MNIHNPEFVQLNNRINDIIRDIGIMTIRRESFSSFLYVSEKIVNSAVSHLHLNSDLLAKDIETLGFFAKALPNGLIKYEFLEQCELLLDYLLGNIEKIDYEAISLILEKVIYISIHNDNAVYNEGNMLKVLDLLSLVYNKIHINPMTTNSYLIPKIGNYIREIGIRAIHRGDIYSFRYAVDKLANIDGASKEMYSLGDAALNRGFMPEAVTMVRNLSSRIRQKFTPDGVPFRKDKLIFSWLGLIARIYKKEGWARKFAELQMINLLKPLEAQPKFLQSLFTDTQAHFYLLADFSTADAILELQQKRYPDLV